MVRARTRRSGRRRATPGARASAAAGPQPQGTSSPGLAPEGVTPPPGPPQPQVQVQLPPPPEVPPLPKGPTPPAAIVGVLSVPDVMRASTAFQQADKEFVGRRQKLNEDAQKEQVALRDLGQRLPTSAASCRRSRSAHARRSCRTASPNRAACSANAIASSRKPANT